MEFATSPRIERAQGHLIAPIPIVAGFPRPEREDVAILHMLNGNELRMNPTMPVGNAFCNACNTTAATGRNAGISEMGVTWHLCGPCGDTLLPFYAADSPAWLELDM